LIVSCFKILFWVIKIYSIKCKHISFLSQETVPNPFNPKTKIRFELPESGNVKLAVYDITGQLVTVLVDEFMNEGIYEREFDGSNLASGIYISVLEARNVKIVRKMQLIK